MKILEFYSKHELVLVQDLKAVGYSDSEIKEAISFVRENPINDNEPPRPPQKKMKLAEVVNLEFRSKSTLYFLKAA